MLEKVEPEKKDLSTYRPVVGDEAINEIETLAEPLQGARVVHVNATAFGGGVAEMLQTLVPLMRDAGLDAEWRVIEGADDFFEVTKACHNGLQGADVEFTDEMKEIWKTYNKKNAQAFEGEYDFVIMHDPQPAGLRHYHEGGDARWIWRCHIDTSEPNPDFWDFFAPFINEHDAGGITLQIIDGETGFLVDSAEQCADRMQHLLEHPEEADRMGTAGRERVRENFLSSRHLTDYLQLFNALS